jgi:UDP-glucose 4-epimerase
MEKILATGMSGTIGRYLPDSVSPVEFRLEDLSQERTPVQIDKDLSLTTMIHLAGIVGHESVKSDPNHSEFINVTSTLNLAKKCFEKDIKKFVFISTSHVYGSSDWDLKENSELNPKSLYAEQKLRAEEGLRSIFLTNPSKLLILRVFSVIGLGMPFFTLPGKVEKYINEKRELEINFADDVRSFTDVSMLAQMIYRLSNLDKADGVINVSSKRVQSVREAISELFAQDKLLFVKFNSGNSELPRIVANTAKMNKLISNV